MPAPRATPALVVDVGWVNGLAAIRSLGRAGVPVLALDHRRSALGFRSRYAERVLSPEPSTDEDGLVRLLRELAERAGAPLPVFPTHDEGLNAISRRLGELGDAVLAPFPPWTRLADVQSKRVQLERAAAAGVAFPATRHPRSAGEALAAGAELGFPVLVKPSDPVGFKRRFRRQAFRCESAADLEAAYAKAAPFEPMVQELVPGGDDSLYSVGSYLDREGRPLGVFCGRKLRQTPPGVGTCRVGEAIWVEEVVEAALRLLRAFSFHGLSQVEFKRDARDGSFKLMEINPRLWQWHGLASACGVDLALIAYEDLLGNTVTEARMRGEGKRWAVTLLSGEAPAFQRPPYVDGVFALDDPGPGLVHLARVLRRAVR